jgi:hypothetical protein
MRVPICFVDSLYGVKFVDMPVFSCFWVADLSTLCVILGIRRRLQKMVKMVPKWKMWRKAEG